MSSGKKRESILAVDFEPTTVVDGVHLVATQGNGVVIGLTDSSSMLVPAHRS
ncbi:MAG: hypothetical protein R2706_06315 [Acidimicrobiales bacterium]